MSRHQEYSAEQSFTVPRPCKQECIVYQYVPVQLYCICQSMSVHVRYKVRLTHRQQFLVVLSIIILRTICIIYMLQVCKRIHLTVGHQYLMTQLQLLIFRSRSTNYYIHWLKIIYLVLKHTQIVFSLCQECIYGTL